MQSGRAAYLARLDEEERVRHLTHRDQVLAVGVTNLVHHIRESMPLCIVEGGESTQRAIRVPSVLSESTQRGPSAIIVEGGREHSERHASSRYSTQRGRLPSHLRVCKGGEHGHALEEVLGFRRERGRVRVNHHVSKALALECPEHPAMRRARQPARRACGAPDRGGTRGIVQQRELAKGIGTAVLGHDLTAELRERRLVTTAHDDVEVVARLTLGDYKLTLWDFEPRESTDHEGDLIIRQTAYARDGSRRKSRVSVVVVLQSTSEGVVMRALRALAVHTARRSRSS